MTIDDSAAGRQITAQVTDKLTVRAAVTNTLARRPSEIGALDSLPGRRTNKPNAWFAGCS